MNVPKIDLHLSDPEMTLMHRAGLAGLYMTLQVLESIRDRPGNLTWTLGDRQISLYWEGRDIDTLDWLLKQSFQIEKSGEKEGLIAFTGLEPKTLDLQNQVVIHQGIRGTFLQHPSTFKSDGQVVKMLQIDESMPFKIQYQKAKSYAHQEFAKALCNDHGELLTQSLSIAGWLNPGAVVRHVAFSGQTGFEEAPKHALALLFAPIACQYFLLRSRLRDKRAQYALVVPEVTNLAEYAERRKDLRTIGFEDFHASSLGDAGLRFLTYETTIKTLETQRIPSCQVVTLGTVAWSSQQKTRTDSEVIGVNARVCVLYQHAKSCFPDRPVKGKDGAFIAPSFACEIVAENLVRNRDWYSDLAGVINSGERFKLLIYEREGLHNMVQMMDETIEKLFVKACHEALSRTYKKIYDYAERKGEIANIDRENERIRTSLGRCKNPETFRQFITDFWSRAGQVPTLQDHWQELLVLATNQHSWKKAKDLTLLALASYKGRGAKATPPADESDYD